MNKINNKTKYNIIFSLGILAILASGSAMPAKAYVDEDVYGGSGNSVWCSNCVTPSNTQTVKPSSNPAPVINSINPKSSNVGVGTKTITITGTGFIPSSIAKVNGSNRPTTFIDSFHLLVQITGNDTIKFHSNGGFFITVFNGAPGGGYSNAAAFAINKNAVSATEATSNTSNDSDTSSNFTDIIETESETGPVSTLASNAIFGANGLYPSGLIQWIFFAILVLLVVILVRKIYGADRKYHMAPMKHD